MSPKMKTLERCARCGKCLTVCPSFWATRLESCSPRGRVAQLKEGFLDAATVSNCLLCGACEAVCPNEVPVFTHLLAARRRYKAFYVPLLRKLLGFIRREGPLRPSDTAGKTLLFLGCAETILYPRAVEAFLEKIKALFPFEVVKGLCCGLPLAASGEEEAFLKIAKENLALLGQAEKVLVFCASCLFTFKKIYPLYLPQEQLAIQDGFSYLLDQGFFRFKAPSSLLFFQVPCHLRHLGLEPWWEGLKHYPGCCGQGGLFGFRHRQEARQIAFPLKKAFLTSGTRFLATSCSACFFRLRTLFPRGSVTPLLAFLEPAEKQKNTGY